MLNNKIKTKSLKDFGRSSVVINPLNIKAQYFRLYLFNHSRDHVSAILVMNLESIIDQRLNDHLGTAYTISSLRLVNQIKQSLINNRSKIIFKNIYFKVKKEWHINSCICDTFLLDGVFR